MYLEHIPYSEDNTITAGSMIDALVERGERWICAICRNRKGINIKDVLQYKNTQYGITQILKVNRTHIKIVAHEV